MRTSRIYKKKKRKKKENAFGRKNMGGKGERKYEEEKNYHHTIHDAKMKTQ